MIPELRTLVAVAREGTFAAAGSRIGLTQAAVSAQMQRLQDELGCALFDKAGRTARLNRMGLQVLQQAQEVIRLYDNLGSAPEGAPGTVVSIGAIASAQRSMLPDAVAALHRQSPGCRTRIVPGVSMQLLDLVDAGELDMAAIIRPPHTLHSDLRWTLLAREPFRLLVPRGMPGDDWHALLARQPFIRYDRTSFGGRQVDRFLRQMHLTPREACEADELDALVKLVANGVGVALVPQTADTRRWPARVRALSLGSHTFHRDIGLVYRPHANLSAPARMLLQIIGGMAPAMEQEDEPQ